MGRGERHMKSNVAERKCIVTGEVQPKRADPFCRVARQSGGVPDLAEKLPGRGMVSSTNAPFLRQSAKTFFRGAKKPGSVDPNLLTDLIRNMGVVVD